MERLDRSRIFAGIDVYQNITEMENDYQKRFQYFDKKMKKEFPDEELRSRGVMRAIKNQDRYYSLLRSTGLDGIEDLIDAIHRSSFSTAHSHSHHHYCTGTLEHCLGVYELMASSPESVNFSDTELIIVGLLHDVCMGHLDEWRPLPGHHGLKSRSIVEKYLPQARTRQFHEAMLAINFHRKPLDGYHPLRKLVYDCDHKDASTCNKGQKF